MCFLFGIYSLLSLFWYDTVFKHISIASVILTALSAIFPDVKLVHIICPTGEYGVRHNLGSLFLGIFIWSLFLIFVTLLLVLAMASLMAISTISDLSITLGVRYTNRQLVWGLKVTYFYTDHRIIYLFLERLWGLGCTCLLASSPFNSLRYRDSKDSCVDVCLFIGLVWCYCSTFVHIPLQVNVW